ncbi:MAG TPA: ABC transporter ATP-binding protein [Anaerolineaceae bacterium]|nr:ABC transporter ATP-binding protein [Anaerolineaceae bacterium]
MPSVEEVIVVQQAERVFAMGSSQVHALRGASLTIRRGEFVALMGASGSGKSTLLNILGCLDTLTGGEYWLEGRAVKALTSDQRAEMRNHWIGFIFQSFNLLPRFSAWENVALPLFYRGKADKPRERALQVLEQVGLADRANHRPNQLSGGEQQRVAVARALVTDPAIVLADEPTGNLDSATGAEIMDLIASVHAQGRTILMVTHDPQVAAYADRRVQMRDGMIIEPGGQK